MDVCSTMIGFLIGMTGVIGVYLLNTRGNFKYPRTIDDAIDDAVLFRSYGDEEILIRVVDKINRRFSGIEVHTLEWRTVSFDEVDLDFDTFLGVEIINVRTE